jgi:hypothetical protein
LTQRFAEKYIDFQSFRSKTGTSAAALFVLSLYLCGKNISLFGQSHTVHNSIARNKKERLVRPL